MCVQGDLCRRWVKLDVTVLREAAETKMKVNVDETAPETVFHFGNKGSGTAAGEEDVVLFEGLPLRDEDFTLPSLLRPTELRTFEDARTVFLRAIVKLENAKKQYPLDGTYSGQGMYSR